MDSLITGAVSVSYISLYPCLSSSLIRVCGRSVTGVRTFWKSAGRAGRHEVSACRRLLRLTDTTLMALLITKPSLTVLRPATKDAVVIQSLQEVAPPLESAVPSTVTAPAASPKCSRPTPPIRKALNAQVGTGSAPMAAARPCAAPAAPLRPSAFRVGRGPVSVALTAIVALPCRAKVRGQAFGGPTVCRRPREATTRSRLSPA